jgi:hypothetical protein
VRDESMLYDQLGNRKYLTKPERQAFIDAAKQAAPEIETFCLTLAYTGAHIGSTRACATTSRHLVKRSHHRKPEEKEARHISCRSRSSSLARSPKRRSQDCRPLQRYGNRANAHMVLEPHYGMESRKDNHACGRDYGRTRNAKSATSRVWRRRHPSRSTAKSYTEVVGTCGYSNNRDLHERDGRGGAIFG